MMTCAIDEECTFYAGRHTHILSVMGNNIFVANDEVGGTFKHFAAVAAINKFEADQTDYDCTMCGAELAYFIDEKRVWLHNIYNVHCTLHYTVYYICLPFALLYTQQKWQSLTLNLPARILRPPLLIFFSLLLLLLLSTVKFHVSFE